MEKNIKNIRQQFKEHGIFYTPTALAEKIKSYIPFTPERVYDPTCGQGNLLSVFPDDVQKYGQELDPDELAKAKERLTNFIGASGDTLKYTAFPGAKFDAIVANPPFSIKWEPQRNDDRFENAPCLPPPSKADYAFILHILHHLDVNKGIAVVMEFPGILYRGAREGKIRQWIVEQNWLERVVHVPGNSFTDTSIATCILVFNKHKTTTDVIFEDLELEEEKTVTLDEIQKNGYTLSVSTYIQKEPEKIHIDPIEQNKKADDLTVATPRLDNLVMICDILGCTLDEIVARKDDE